MTRRIAIAAVLLYLFAHSLGAQITQQPLIQPSPQARQQLAKTLQEQREKSDLHGEAITLLQLGTVDAGLGNIEGAQNNLAEAVRKMRAQNDPLGAWLALTGLTQIQVALGRPAEAIPHIEKAITILNEAKTSTAPLKLETLLALGAAPGLSPQMLQMLEGPGAEMMKSMMLQNMFEPITHDLYGSVLTQVGQLEKAETELKAATAGSTLSQGMYDFSIESHFGDLRFKQQRYDEARTHYMKALNASSKTAMLLMGGDAQIKLGIYDRLARLESSTGHPEEAKRWSAKARELVKNARKAVSHE